MAASDKTFPKVYLFKEDYDMIQELVRRRPAEQTGGDLFGLWTNDDEPVLHIVTGQGIQIHQSQQALSSNNELKSLGTVLRDKFHLIHIGKWQYMRLSEQTETAIIAAVGQDTLAKRANARDFLLILASCAISSERLELTPYFLSQFSILTKGDDIRYALPGRSVFRKDDDIANIADALMEIESGPSEDESNQLSLGSKHSGCGNPDGSETEASRSDREPSDVDMRDEQEENNERRQGGGKITTKSIEKGLENTDPMLKVYIFQDDLQMIKDFVGCNPDVVAGGDLFGLWTNGGEPVLHKITRQHQEILKASVSKDENAASELDCVSKTFHLSCVGRWQYKSSCQNIKSEIEATVDRRSLRGKIGIVALVFCHKEEESVSAFLLSEDSCPREMEIEVLNGKGVFREMKEATGTTDALEHKDDRHEETNQSESQLISDVTTVNLQRLQTNFVCNQRRLKVYLFAEDLEMMEGLVLRYPNVETGGDLFGLWTSDGDAVLHVVLGPGQNCKRTGTSFYQDVPYLQKNGELLTQDYMLCHIGEWHSHHQLHLFKPSHGDSSTVIRHYPHGTCGFLLIIANIVSQDRVQLSPYLYTARSVHNFHQKGEIFLLPSRNAFKRDVIIMNRMSEGRETRHHFQSGMVQYPRRHFLLPIEIPPSRPIEPRKESNCDTSEEPMDTDEAEMHSPSELNSYKTGQFESSYKT